MDLVPGGEAVGVRVAAVLPQSAFQIIGHSGIEDNIGPVGQDIDKVIYAGLLEIQIAASACGLPAMTGRGGTALW